MTLNSEDREKTRLLLDSLAKDNEEIFSGLNDHEVSRHKKLLWSFSTLQYLRHGGSITDRHNYRNEAARCLQYPKSKGFVMNDEDKVKELEAFISRIGDYLFCIARDLLTKQLIKEEIE